MSPPTFAFVFFFLLLRPTPRSTLFPYTTLFRSERRPVDVAPDVIRHRLLGPFPRLERLGEELELARRCWEPRVLPPVDRKSTRLNSSHRTISYAVFCLKKKK